MRKRNLIAGRGAEHRRGKPRLGNTSFTKQKCRTGTGPSPSPTDCPSSMRGGALESVQPEGRWVRWAGKYHPPLPRNGIVFVLAQRQVASILFFPHWFTGLVTLTHLQSSCPLIWSLESLRGTQIIPRSLEMVSVLTRARDAGQGLMRTRHLLTRHRVVTPGVCGYAGSGFRSELSPLWLTAGWLARQPGPLAVLFVPSLRAGTSVPEPLGAALPAQPVFSPRLCDDHVHGFCDFRFGSWDYLSCERSQPLFSAQGHPVSSEFSKCSGSCVSNRRP